MNKPKLSPDSQMYLKQNCAQIAGTLKNRSVEELIENAKGIEAYIIDVDFDVVGMDLPDELMAEVKDPDQTELDLEKL